MPWIPFYAAADDLRLLNEMLASDGDLALLTHEGGDVWRARRDFELTDPGRFSLWHVPGGPIPLLHESHLGEAYGEVEDPFGGWSQARVGEDGRPWLGDPPNIINIDIRISCPRPGNAFGMSSASWIGNYFARLGAVAPEVTKKRWSKLRTQLSKAGPRVPRGWLERERKPEIIALPHAHALLKSGAKGDVEAF